MRDCFTTFRLERQISKNCEMCPNCATHGNFAPFIEQCLLYVWTQFRRCQSFGQFFQTNFTFYQQAVWNVNLQNSLKFSKTPYTWQRWFALTWFSCMFASLFEFLWSPGKNARFLQETLSLLILSKIFLNPVKLGNNAVLINLGLPI